MKSAVFALGFYLIGALSLSAGETDSTEIMVTETKWDLDALWRRAVLFESDDPSDLLQRLSVSGRIHYDYVNLHADVGDLDEWAFRRTRIGFLAKFRGHISLRSEVTFEPNRADPFYLGLANTYVQYDPTPDVSLRIGKQAPYFTLDGSESSNELLTLDRNLLSRNLWFVLGQIPGITLNLKNGPWSTGFGLFSGGSFSKEFGNFDGSLFGLVKEDYDLSEAWGVEEASLGLHYVYQDPDPLNTFTLPLEHIGSLNFRFHEGHWGFRSDLAGGKGALGQSDLGGFVLMPFYDLSDRLQIVTRYTWLESADPNGLRLNLYEFLSDRQRGDRLQEGYIGLNCFLHGHRLKWQNGLKYTHLADQARDGGAYDGWSYESGFRISW
ncbi:MAG: hypothetical protein KDL87_00835 [Verrucomicrobiae bacterium]|nr:hypothetical protein [Verrucomicrobiae bacterium]